MSKSPAYSGISVRASGWMLAVVLLLTARAALATFTEFESGQVRPLALSPDGTKLFAVNTPDNELEIFSVSGSGLAHTGSVPVGLEPVAVAARTNTEVWVVNHLSDSVSIVDLSTSPPRVTRTLLTCDEPRDLVFASGRAFITTARRGQNCPVLAVLTTAGQDRAVVQVFDPANLGATLGGTPLTNVTLFGDTPRALATDGTTVYAAIFQSGNQTTALNEGLVCNGGGAAAPCNVFGLTMPGGLPAPNANLPQGITGPETGLIVKFNVQNGRWEDRLGRNWNNGVRFSLPDLDVFKINAAAPTPVQTGSFAGVGTVLFNMAVNPVSGKVYVSNTDARNEVRFEGPGGGGSTVRGHLAESRITVLDGATVTPRHLNKHIVYATVPSPPGTAAASLATPTGLAVTANGATLYVAAFGSSAVGVFGTSALENNTFTPSAASHIAVTGGGPSGLVLDETNHKLYVLTRFDDAVSEINITTNSEVAHHRLHNPEPASVVTGRPLLYDAVATSSNGEAACASCHIFGDFDSLGWDLGNPDDVVLSNPNPIRLTGGNPNFHPLKGPMTTQSLRGMANHGPMHWRGDRTAGNDPGGNPLDEHGAFTKFNVAFGGLLGRTGPITDTAMGAFADFILQVNYPPNPIRSLNNTLKNPAAPAPSEQRGHDFYFNVTSDTLFTCNGCHVLDAAQGFFGGDGQTTFENETQMFKVPHLRNAYQKAGMFGMPAVAFLTGGDNGNKGAQVRGFGFLHDGSVDTLFRFHGASVFSTNTQNKLDLEAFLLAFDSDLAPIVGQQITLTSTNAATVGPRITLLEQRAAAGECALTVKGVVGGLARGAVRLANGTFQTDRLLDPPLTDTQVRALATTPGQELTFLCAPPGSGLRVGVDRDEDDFFDRDELDAGTDPANPLSFPGASSTTTTTSTTTSSAPTTSSTLPPVVLIQSSQLVLKDDSVSPFDPLKRKFAFRSNTKRDPAQNRITPPSQGSPDNPFLAGAVLQVYNAAGVAPDFVTVTLPANHWTAIGSPGAEGYAYSDPSGVAPIYSARVKRDSIMVKGRRAGWPYTLDEASQGRVAVTLRLGTDTAWCAAAPAKTLPTIAINDHLDKFVGQPKTPAPPSCPPTP
jgi:DNA-binding beta-propeller fold protein YncE